jgi:hypothetical protein
MGPRPTPRAQRYRRYRILGLLPGLVMVGGGLYLGLAQQNWLVLVAGAAFLLLCAAMIASDRPAARPWTRSPESFDSSGHARMPVDGAMDQLGPIATAQGA